MSHADSARRGTLIERLLGPMRAFLALGPAPGILLMTAAAVAMLWANSPWAESYKALWHTPVAVTVGSGTLNHSLEWWINDVLMAVFFVLVGLEIKREALTGHLASPRKAAAPIAAAIGGMVVPAGIYWLWTGGTPLVRGWGVPMATDIAFALGVLALAGKRVPSVMRVFLATLAIVDDLGALIVIAVFYTEKINGNALVSTGAVLALMVLANRAGVRSLAFYILGTAVLWWYVHASGVHATVAGVLGAMTVPATAGISKRHFAAELRLALEKGGVRGDERGVSEEGPWADSIHTAELAARDAQSPLLRLEHMLTAPVNFLILPVFALANAGVALGAGGGEGGAGAGATWNTASWGIVFGLAVGKPVGIFAATWLAVKAGVGTLPEGLTWGRVLALGALGGIGFTMALFIAHLAFPDPGALASAKLAVLAGSAVAGVMGGLWLSRVIRR